MVGEAASVLSTTEDKVAQTRPVNYLCVKIGLSIFSSEVLPCMPVFLYKADYVNFTVSTHFSYTVLPVSLQTRDRRAKSHNVLLWVLSLL